MLSRTIGQDSLSQPCQHAMGSSILISLLQSLYIMIIKMHYMYDMTLLQHDDNRTSYYSIVVTYTVYRWVYVWLIALTFMIENVDSVCARVSQQSNGHLSCIFERVVSEEDGFSRSYLKLKALFLTMLDIDIYCLLRAMRKLPNCLCSLTLVLDDGVFWRYSGCCAIEHLP